MANPDTGAASAPLDSETQHPQDAALPDAAPAEAADEPQTSATQLTTGDDADQHQHQQAEAAQDEQQGPASSPLPARPTAVAPGPRAIRLGETYAHALRRTLAKLAAWDNFAGCYPTIAARAEGVLRQVQEQMVDKLGDKCEKEFDNILAARGVVPKLNELEALMADAAERHAEASPDDPEPIPPHLLPAADVAAAHLAAHRADVDALLARLDAVAADVRGANEALGRIADELARESRAAGIDGVP
ncbi:hypothetical protein HIM_07656 [Hirsutella minnesotensis 3608]|uniref:Nnf1-domain-containing protein n=1 Tax=Hirsutella minnesotensis 3608 TaxID=1043627 RepID=A0A0F7ZTC9_9HYPO|nr:hypothetical protein HIM_07656 [Hirsutella minnesotensis 3608]